MEGKHLNAWKKKSPAMHRRHSQSLKSTQMGESRCLNYQVIPAFSNKRGYSSKPLFLFLIFFLFAFYPFESGLIPTEASNPLQISIKLESGESRSSWKVVAIHELPIIHEQWVLHGSDYPRLTDMVKYSFIHFVQIRFQTNHFRTRTI